MRLLRYPVCLVLCLAIQPGSAWSADTLDSLVITGTRSERTLADVPVRTEVVSRAELARTHARSAAEALRHAPGILLRDIHGKNGQEAWLQGMDSDRVLVLLDGRPITASTGSTVDLAQLSIGGVDRIEVVKGAVSALYGSAAMGGVINIISRQPAAGSTARLQVDAGSYGRKGIGGEPGIDKRHLDTGVAFNSGAVGGRLDIDVIHSDGFELDRNTVDTEGGRGSRASLDAQLEFSPAERTDIAFESNWFREDIDRDFASFAPGVGDIPKLDGELAERYTQTLSFSHDLVNGIGTSGFLRVETLDDDTRQDVIGTVPIDQQRSAKLGNTRAELQIDVPQGDSWNWALGAVLSKADLAQDQRRIAGSSTIATDEIRNGAETQTAEAFIQNDVFVSDAWEFVPGLRYQNDSDFGSHLAPKINALYTPFGTRPGTTDEAEGEQGWPQGLSGWAPRFRAGLGTGYRVPSLKERFFRFDHSVNGYVVLGNTDLQPEESLSIQGGVELGGGDQPLAEISLFWNQFDDLITTTRDAAASAEQQLDVFRYSNVASARTWGAETRLAWSATRALEVSMAYTWLNTEDLDTGKALPRRPDHQVQAGIDWTLSKWQTVLTLKASYQSAEFVDSENLLSSAGFGQIDLKLNQPIGERLIVFAGIDNAGDVHRDSDAGGTDFRPDAGRFLYTGLRYDFL